MVVISVGCVLIVISLFLFMLSYRMYSSYGLLQSGLALVRVRTRNQTYRGWVQKSSISALDRINRDRYQWFIELYSDKKYVIKIEEITEVSVIRNPISILFSGSWKGIKEPK